MVQHPDISLCLRMRLNNKAIADVSDYEQECAFLQSDLTLTLPFGSFWITIVSL